jgi:hypothetical protein
VEAINYLDCSLQNSRGYALKVWHYRPGVRLRTVLADDIQRGNIMNAAQKPELEAHTFAEYHHVPLCAA